MHRLQIYKNRIILSIEPFVGTIFSHSFNFLQTFGLGTTFLSTKFILGNQIIVKKMRSYMLYNVKVFSFLYLIKFGHLRSNLLQIVENFYHFFRIREIPNILFIVFNMIFLFSPMQNRSDCNMASNAGSIWFWAKKCYLISYLHCYTLYQSSSSSFNSLYVLSCLYTLGSLQGVPINMWQWQFFIVFLNDFLI